MKKISFLFLFATLTLFVKAEEGMLIPTLLNAFESDMQAMGMEISAQDIYDANNASIKDAIFHFGGGCTSSTISNKGLLLTNHHCGYSQIYSHTTVENNIANNGYWAKDLSEELKNDGLTATRMVKIQDVTDAVLAGTLGLSEADAAQKIRVNIARIKAEELDGTFYEADIKACNFRNSYYLFVEDRYRDRRRNGSPTDRSGRVEGERR